MPWCRASARLVIPLQLYSKEPPMRSKIVIALVLLNVALLVTLFVPNPFTRTAKAAIPGRPSEYLQATGEVQGGSSGVVYVLDTKNNWLSVVAFGPDGKTLDAMPPIDLNRVFKH